MAFQSILDPTEEQVLKSMEWIHVTSEGRLIVDLNNEKVYQEISSKVGPYRPSRKSSAVGSTQGGSTSTREPGKGSAVEGAD